MDAFYASVEQRRHPELRGKPVIVGGEGPRGVVAAASYEARVYGIRSAMASTQARRLCPEAIFVSGDHAHYAEVSQSVMAIFTSYTPLVEPISLDEAFLDVSGALRVHGTPVDIAQLIRDDVYRIEQLTCSVGVAPNKFLAKLATEEAKPRPSTAGPIPGLGVKVVEPDRIQAFLDPLPIRAVWGVGPKTADRLDRLGVATVLDLRRLSVEVLVRSLGKVQGRHLYELARGIDARVVEPNLGAKSISHEETFSVDLFNPQRIASEIVRMGDAVGKRLRASDLRGRTVQLKVRFGDFTTITRSITINPGTDSGTVIAREANTLMGRIDPSPGIRLLGVGVSSFAARGEGQQLSFDDLATSDQTRDDSDWREAESAIDEIREKFGTAAIGPASTLGRGGLRPKERGDQQWGPDAEQHRRE